MQPFQCEQTPEQEIFVYEKEMNDAEEKDTSFEFVNKYSKIKFFDLVSTKSRVDHVNNATRNEEAHIKMNQLRFG